MNMSAVVRCHTTQREVILIDGIAVAAYVFSNEIKSSNESGRCTISACVSRGDEKACKTISAMNAQLSALVSLLKVIQINFKSFAFKFNVDFVSPCR